jgi:hypothetical protein
MQSFGAHALVVFARVMLGIIIAAIGFSTFPIHDELATTDLVTDPIVAHVHGFRPALLDAVVSNAAGGAIVRDHWGGRLGMAKFLERDAFRNGFFSIVEKPS